MLDVFRFAWFAVRTFLGVIALILAGYVALYLFVKVLERRDVQQRHRSTTVSRAANVTAASCVRRFNDAFQVDEAKPRCETSDRFRPDR